MSEEGPPRTPTTRVGKYELGRTLGRGNFAKVKHAWNIHTGEEYAIKILNRDNVLRLGMVDQIKREIKTMKEIRHPNVVRIYEVMATREKIYIVLELVDAGQLFDKIAKNGRLKEDEARKYFQQLMNAVDYCHSRGVYHRDLKPQNLLLDSCGVIKVSDFGFSAFSQQGQKDGGLLHTACGTPNYVAPEVLTDKGYDGTSADIWSCGVILFVLVAGSLPFDHPNLMALYKKIERAEFCYPSWFSTGLKKLIKSILDPNPSTRITISGIHQDDWFKKNNQPPNFGPKCDVNLHDVDASTSTSAQEDYITERGQKKPASMNAFDLITGSEGFNLKNLFERRKSLMRPSETRFTSQYTAQEIASKIEEAAKSLNFVVRRSSYKIKLEGHRRGRKGHLSVATEVYEAAPSFQVVKLHKTGGDTLEFQEFYVNFLSGLKDIIWK